MPTAALNQQRARVPGARAGCAYWVRVLGARTGRACWARVLAWNYGFLGGVTAFGAFHGAGAGVSRVGSRAGADATCVGSAAGAESRSPSSMPPFATSSAASTVWITW